MGRSPLCGVRNTGVPACQAGLCPFTWCAVSGGVRHWRGSGVEQAENEGARPCVAEGLHSSCRRASGTAIIVVKAGDLCH